MYLPISERGVRQRSTEKRTQFRSFTRSRERTRQDCPLLQTRRRFANPTSTDNPERHQALGACSRSSRANIFQNRQLVRSEQHQLGQHSMSVLAEDPVEITLAAPLQSFAPNLQLFDLNDLEISRRSAWYKYRPRKNLGRDDCVNAM